MSAVFAKTKKSAVPIFKPKTETKSKRDTKTESGLPRSTKMMYQQDGKRTAVIFYHFDPQTLKATFGTSVETKDETSDSKESKETKTKTKSKTDAQRKQERKLSRDSINKLCKTAIQRTVHADARTVSIPTYKDVQSVVRAKNEQILKLRQELEIHQNPDEEADRVLRRQQLRDRVAYAFKQVVAEDGGKSLANAKRIKRSVQAILKNEEKVARDAFIKKVDAQTRLDMEKYVRDKVAVAARCAKQVEVDF
jgi:hypothetical protein